MKRIMPLLSLLLIIGLSSCKNVTSMNAIGLSQIKGNGNLVTENRVLDQDFAKVQAYSIVKVHLTKGDNLEIKIEAEENLLEYIVTEVRNGVLELGTKGNITPSKEINIYVEYQNLDEITSSGVTQVTVNSPIAEETIGLTSTGTSNIKLGTVDAEYVTLKTSGTSNITANSLVGNKTIKLECSGVSNIITETLETSDLTLSTSGSSRLAIANARTENTKATLSGASNMKLEGETNSINAQISGSSSFNAKSLLSKTANLKTSGASNAQVSSNKSLDVIASGASSITVYGKPEHITKETSGSASVRQR